MADRWHLSMDSNDIKGNNPYQLSRMSVDPSFRKPGGYDLKAIQGYSATGDVVLKGERLSLAPPRDPGLRSTGSNDIMPSNFGCHVASYHTVYQQPAPQPYPTYPTYPTYPMHQPHQPYPMPQPLRPKKKKSKQKTRNTRLITLAY